MRYRLHYVALIFSMIAFTSAFSLTPQEVEKAKKKVLQEHVQSSSQGRLFWLAIPPNEAPDWTAHEVEIYVASSYDCTVTLSNADGRNIIKKVKAMEVATFSSLTQELDFGMEVRGYERPLRQGIKIESDKPVSVYVLNAKQTTSEGFLAIPVASWGTEYRHLSTYDYNEASPYESGFIILASQPNTTVRIALIGKGKGMATTQMGRNIGDTWTVTLQEGEVYYVAGNARTAAVFDMSGSRITADKPIGLISCHERVILPARALYGITNGRDHLSEMMPPVPSWGKEYYTVEYKRDKQRGDLFRIVAGADNMQVKCKWFDLKTGEVLGNWEPLFAKTGDVDEYIEAWVKEGSHDLRSIRGASIWKSDKPFLLMQYAYSANWDGNSIFDPFMILVTPIEQYVTGTVYQTPSNAAFQENFFNIIALHDSNDVAKNDLKSIKIDGKPLAQIEPTFIFNQIPTTQLYWAKLKSLPGPHKIVGDGKVKFGGYIYGFSEFDSYGWPAAMAIRNLEELDTLPPVLLINGECGEYSVNATELRNGGEKDNPRQIDMGVTEEPLMDTEFSYNFLGPIFPTPWKGYPSNKKFDFGWTVENKYKDAFILFSVYDMEGNIAIDSIRYEPDSLVVTPRPVDFGNVRLGKTNNIEIKVKSESDSVITLTKIYMKKGDVYSIISGQVPPETQLPSRDVHKVLVQYKPKVEWPTIVPDKADNDSLIVETKCLRWAFPVTGKGVQARIEIEDWNAGTHQINSVIKKSVQTLQKLKVTNTGTDTLTLFGVSTDLNTVKPFEMPAPKFPIKVAPNSSTFIEDVFFKPIVNGSWKFDVIFANDGVGPDSVSIWEGASTNPGPYITGFRWPWVREATVNKGTVYVRNSGTQSIKITDVKFATADGNFAIDKANTVPNVGVNGAVVDLAPESGSTGIREIAVPVIYTPNAFGSHTVTIEALALDNLQQTITVSNVLDGTAFLPKIATTGYEFKNPILVNSLHPDMGEVSIEALSEVTDTLHIYEIKTAATALHPADFTFLSSFPKDSFILKNQPLKINVQFRPTSLGDRKTTLEVWSDADRGPNVAPRVVALIDVIGHAYDKGGNIDSLDFETVSLCEERLADVTLRNPIPSTGDPAADANATNTIKAVTWVTNPDNVFSADLNAPVNQKMPPLSIYAIKVAFKPKSNIAYTGLLKVELDNNGTPMFLYSVVKGTGFNMPIEISLKDILNIPPGQVTVNQNGNNYDFEVRAKSNNWKDAQITNFQITIAYKTTAMRLVKNPSEITWLNLGANVFKGDLLPSDWTVTAQEMPHQSDPSMTMTVVSGQGATPIPGAGSILAKPVFQILLSESSEFSPEIIDTRFGSRDACIVPSDLGAKITTNNCVQDLRNVVISGENYNLMQIAPNPVKGSTMKVNFNVAFTQNVKIVLINTTGEVVKELINGNVKSGPNSLEANIGEISSGMYTIKMESGPYVATQQIMIIK